jgi:hypothetical protein
MKLKITNPSKLRGRKLHWPDWYMEVTSNLMTLDDSEYVFTCDVTRNGRRSQRFYLHLHRETLRMQAIHRDKVTFSNPIFLYLNEVKDMDRLVDRMMHLINEII